MGFMEEAEELSRLVSRVLRAARRADDGVGPVVTEVRRDLASIIKQASGMRTVALSKRKAAQKARREARDRGFD